MDEGDSKKARLGTGGYFQAGVLQREEINAYLAKQLIGYKYTKGSIRFPLNQPIQKALVIEMVQYRYAQVNNTKP